MPLHPLRLNLRTALPGTEEKKGFLSVSIERQAYAHNLIPVATPVYLLSNIETTDQWAVGESLEECASESSFWAGAVAGTS